MRKLADQRREEALLRPSDKHKRAKRKVGKKSSTGNSEIYMDIIECRRDWEDEMPVPDSIITSDDLVHLIREEDDYELREGEV